MDVSPRSVEAYRLLHEGTLAFGRAEMAGMRVDVDYCERKKAQLTQRIQRLEDRLRRTKFFRHWQHSQKGKVNIGSNYQLARFLYDKLAFTPAKLTASGQGATDEESLLSLGIPEVETIVRIRKLKKIRDTYLDAYVREQADGWIHPFFNLNLVRTFRSCVAKGTKILAVRDFESDGVLIENIRAGDYVYCFDDDLRPTIRKVLWAGKTGCRRVIRIHYYRRGGHGFLDVTPEHKVRLVDGRYVQAKDLVGDFRGSGDSKHSPWVHVLAGGLTPDDRSYSFVPGNHVVTKIEWIDKVVDVYDLEVEGCHNFIANEICVHNSSDHPNFQNIPKRDQMAMRICRRALYPRKGHQFLEADYGGIEVKVGLCYHKDPTMMSYILDPASDMHGDTACEVFFLDTLDKGIFWQKTLRGAAKNGFVFPQFYGDYYRNCATYMACHWCGLPREGRWKPGQGMELERGFHISDHFLEHGVRSLDDFVEHIKQIEDRFWGERFRRYAAWKERTWWRYQKRGYVDMLTGFRCSGLMSRNDATNYPIQGAAFHCLLWSFIELDRIQREEGWDSRLIGQIHDALVLDVHPAELEHVAKTIQRVTCVDLPKAWDWIVVPLDIEMDLSPVDGSWADKESFSLAA